MMRRVPLRVSVLLLSVAAMSGCENVGRKCTTDAQCKFGEVCISNICFSRVIGSDAGPSDAGSDVDAGKGDGGADGGMPLCPESGGGSGYVRPAVACECPIDAGVSEICRDGWGCAWGVGCIAPYGECPQSSPTLGLCSCRPQRQLPPTEICLPGELCDAGACIAAPNCTQLPSRPSGVNCRCNLRDGGYEGCDSWSVCSAERGCGVATSCSLGGSYCVCRDAPVAGGPVLFCLPNETCTDAGLCN